MKFPLQDIRDKTRQDSSPDSAILLAHFAPGCHGVLPYMCSMSEDINIQGKTCPNDTSSSHQRIPLQRIAMDIVGALPRSQSGNRYVLVVCDYATRYPEAVALRSIDAECIAEELIAEQEARQQIWLRGEKCELAYIYICL